ncbi:MAG: ABC transporter permease, partial [Rhodobacteraceae bacterium]|nr:ABC transporter permease [Paracoccaceae bacterium]
MTRFVLHRVLSLAASLFVASLVVFAVIEVIPGDPAAYMLGLNASPDTVAALRETLGLNQSLPMRYLGWVGGMLTGDLGTSYTYRVPVAELVGDRLAVSLPLAAGALVLSTALALPAGLVAAARRGRAADAAVIGATQLGIAVPNFWFA